jgi:hypothetical protein
MLRLPPERMGEALVSLFGPELLERDGDILSPTDWASRQYRSDSSSAEPRKRHRRRHGDVTVTSPEQITDQNRSERADLIEVTDPVALDAWDEYGRRTAGRAFPRNRRGTWHHPTKFPPIHALTGRKA